MLPMAYEPLRLLFEAINESPKVFKDVEFHFIGTGYNSNDSSSYNIKKHALNYGLWQTVIFEYPQRIPYLDVLVHHEIYFFIFNQPKRLQKRPNLVIKEKLDFCSV